MDTTALRPTNPTHREKGQLRAGFRYAATTVAIGVPLVMMALVGCFAYEFQVVLPALAKSFHGGGATYGFMTASMGVGAIFGGLYTAARGRTGVRAMITSSAVFGVVLLLASVAPTLPLELVALLDRRRGERVIPLQGQQFAATRCGTADARPRDGVMGRRISRLHPYRRTHRGRCQRILRRPLGIGARRKRVPASRRVRRDRLTKNRQVGRRSATDSGRRARFCGVGNLNCGIGNLNKRELDGQRFGPGDMEALRPVRAEPFERGELLDVSRFPRR